VTSHHSVLCQTDGRTGYTADVLQSAQALADHASRPGPSKIEKEDVGLAISMRRRYEFFEAPPRDVRLPYLPPTSHLIFG